MKPGISLVLCLKPCAFGIFPPERNALALPYSINAPKGVEDIRTLVRATAIFFQTRRLCHSGVDLSCSARRPGDLLYFLRSPFLFSGIPADAPAAYFIGTRPPSKDAFSCPEKRSPCPNSDGIVKSPSLDLLLTETEKCDFRFPLIFCNPSHPSREGQWNRFRKGISGMPEFLRSRDQVVSAPDRRIGPFPIGL